MRIATGAFEEQPNSPSNARSIANGNGCVLARRLVLQFGVVLCLALVQLSVAAAAQTEAGSRPASAGGTSVWIQQEQSRFTDLLAKHPVDALVVPFQVSGQGLDPVERMLMAGHLADHLTSNTKLSVADPVLVGRALGEGSRTYSEDDILSLANAVHATSVLIGTVGHDGRRKLSVAVKLMRKNAGGRWQVADQKSWDTLQLSDETPPYRALAAAFPGVQQLLGAPSARQSAAKISLSPPGSLPRLDDLLQPSASVNIHVAQLLASLFPRYPEPPHERAWVQTLRLAHLASASSDNRLAVARALMRLGRRPAALTALGEPRTSAEHALREILNGNLPAATAQASRIKDPVLRLIAQIELRDLRMDYEAANPPIEVSQLDGLLADDSEWYPFLYVRVHGEGSVWRVESVIQAVGRFENLLRSGAALEQMTNLFAQLKDADELEVQLASKGLARYDALVRTENPKSGTAGMSRWLLLDLYQAQIATDLLGDVYLTMDTRADPDSGNKLLARLDPILRGHPDFYAAKARLGWREYARWRGEQRARWLQVALANSRDAYRFSNRLSKAIEFTERQAPYTPEIAAALDPVRKEYFRHWPVYVTWVPSAVRENRAAMEQYADELIKYAISSYSTIDWLAGMHAAASRQDALRRSVQGRFDGDPNLVMDQASALLSSFKMQEAEDAYRRYVAASPMALDPYYYFAELLIAQGRHQEASQMFLAYPGFAKDSGASTVAMSNYTGGLAWLWWPIGQFDYAKPFFERSARYRTGSGYSLQSAALLALDNGDPNAAAKLYMDLALRYSDLNALSDYFDLIFALGRPEEAWRIYEEVYRDGNAGKVLRSISRGVRVLGWTDEQTIEWLSNSRNAALADGTYFYSPRAALSAAVMDRELPADLPAVIRKVDAPSPYQVDKQRRMILARTAPGAVTRELPPVCGPSRYAGGVEQGSAIPDSVDSHLMYFARGYQALDRAQHAEAFKVFDEAARLFEAYGTRCEPVDYMIPYLALAAGMVKNTKALEQYLQEIAYRDRSFSYNLALAILAALDSKHEQADRYFEAALNRWATSGSGLPSAYIYADVLERLYKQTQDAIYRERLLRWAKIRQRVSPTDAWAYAKEYRYTSNAADRQRALGMALYLDRQSATLRGVKPQEAAAAQAALAANNPFLAWRKTPKPKSSGVKPQQTPAGR